MTATVNPAFSPGEADLRSLNLTIVGSLVVHLVIVLALFFAPRPKPTPPPLMITLGGTAGPSSTGMSSIGGRTVEQVAPPPKRLEPARLPAQEETSVAVVKSTPPPQTKQTAPPRMETVQPVVTGPKITEGNTPADTGARGRATGLSFGGDNGAGGLTDLKDFCCPDYLKTIEAKVSEAWKRNQPAVGSNRLRFTILRNGQITGIEFEQLAESNLLNRASKAALEDTRLPQLPAAYTGISLTVHTTFDYTGQ